MGFLRNRLPFLIVAVLVIIGIAVVAARTYRTLPDHLILSSGFVSGDEIEISPRIAGQITELLVREGSAVGSGEEIVKLDDRIIRSKREQIESQSATVRANLLAGEHDLALTEKTLRDGINIATSAVGQAEADVKKAEANLDKLSKDAERYRRLFEQEAVSSDTYESRQRAYLVGTADLEYARAGLSKARQALEQALNNRGIIDVKREQVNALRKSLRVLDDQRNQADVELSYAVIASPVDGVVNKKVANVGETVAPGSLLMTVITPGNLYVKAYITEKQLGAVGLNAPARVYADAYPRRHFEGYVCYLSQKAEFTPKEVQTHEERVKQVFAIKVCFTEFPPELKLGLPVDVVVSLSSEKRWYNPILKGYE